MTNNGKDRRDSEKSRRDLLDELYYVQDVAGEREQQILQLHEQLAAKDAVIAATRGRLAFVRASRSWLLTAPLRKISRWLGLARNLSPPARDTGVSVHDPATVARATGNGTVRVEVIEALYAGKARAENPKDGRARLFIDITELALHAGKTGIQRVVREITRAVLASPPAGYVVEPVVATPGARYRIARSFSESPSDAKAAGIDPQPGDVFLMLDLAMRAVAEHAGELAAWRARGVRLWFVCHDTLPLSHPDWFDAVNQARYRTWFETVTGIGDGVACISRATAAALRHWLKQLQVPRTGQLAIGHFHLGAEIDATGSTSAISADEQIALDRVRGSQAFLMVGTLEPRKGHAQALQAFEELWARGHAATLVIAGVPGWMTEVVQRRIRHHDEFGERLFWFMSPSDAVLEQLYRNCGVLLAASEGEGFGLPLIEAARFGLPILCRDLPVFREVAGDFATYFSGTDATSLADAIERWLAARARGEVASSAAMPRLTWPESAQQLLGIVLGSCNSEASNAR